MGATYTRQSSGDIVDGSTIEASHFNDEFDQVLAAFAVSTGHTHDGTAAEGGPVTKLLGTSLTIGDGTAGTDITLTFDGETNNGVLTWMEDEDLFKFTDVINVGVDDAGHDVKLFGDTASRYWLWDTSADGVVQIGTLTVGVDDAGHDVKFFGNTASAYMLWDTSADDLVLAGAAGIDLAGDIDVDGTANLDNTDIDGTFAVDGTTISLDATTSLNIDNSNTSNGITLGTATSGVPISIGHTTSETTVNDNLTVTGTLTGTLATAAQGSVTSLGTLTALSVDNITINGNDISSTAGTDLTITPLSGQQIVLDGTIVVDAGVVTGATSITSTAFVGDITGDITGTADLATSITASANNSTDETVYPTFVDGATGTQGLETDTGLTYNPSSGILTSTQFTGAVVGNVTGNASGTAATVTTAAQTNITSLGTLTALTVDDVAINGKVVTMTGSASDTAVLTAGTNGTLSIVTTDDAAAAANIQITADGTVDIDSAGVLTLDSGAAINIEPESGSAILLDGTISIDAGVVTGATSITSTVFVGNVTGNASGTAATVTTAAQTNITSLGTLTALTVDDVAIDGKVVTMTGSSSDTAVFTAGTNGTLSIVTTDAAAAAANIQITADGTAELAGTTVTLDSAADIELEATNDINIPSDVGLTFGDDGEKIEGDGSDLTISGNTVNLDSSMNHTFSSTGKAMVLGL